MRRRSALGESIGCERVKPVVGLMGRAADDDDGEAGAGSSMLLLLLLRVTSGLLLVVRSALGATKSSPSSRGVLPGERRRGGGVNAPSVASLGLREVRLREPVGERGSRLSDDTTRRDDTADVEARRSRISASLRFRDDVVLLLMVVLLPVPGVRSLSSSGVLRRLLALRAARALFGVRGVCCVAGGAVIASSSPLASNDESISSS